MGALSDSPMQSGEGTHRASGRGRGKRGTRSKESSRRATAFRLDNAVDGVFTTWEAEHGGSEQSAARFTSYRNNRSLSLVTPRLHEDALNLDLHTWTATQHARQQHTQFRQEEQHHRSNHHRRVHVPRLGALPATRPDGVFRWMYCQLNGLAEPKRREEKLTQLTELARTHDIDGAALCEVGINWGRTPRRSWFTLANLINTKMDREVRATISHNIHGPRRSTGQYGGTGIVAFNSGIQYAQGTAHDHRQLGRWASWIFSSSPVHRTRVVTAYCPGKSRRDGLKTVYQQHLRYIQSHQLACTPYQLFVQDLTEQVKCWVEAGDRILLFIDANEHILDGLIGRKLTAPRLGLVEVTHRLWGDTPPHTFIDGSMPIDGVFASPELEVTNSLMLSFHESVGDHRSIIIEVSTRSMLGQHQSSIVRPTTRRLTTKQPQSVSKYNACFLAQCTTHNIQTRTSSLLSAVRSTAYPVATETADEIMGLHSQMDEIRTRSERDCRRILKPAVAFSPVIAFWNDKIHVLQQLLRIKEGNHPGINRGHAYRTAKRKNISSPWNLSIADCKEGIRLAKLRQVEVRKQADAHRKQHLRTQLQKAIDDEDEPEQKNIRNRMRRESSKLAWRRINRVTRSATGRSCLQAQEEVDGQLITYTEKEGVEGAIQRECEGRFRLGHSAPITNSLLGQEVGYLTDARIALDIITGTYQIPDDMDTGTALILTEIGKVGKAVRELGPTKELIVTGKDYKTYWSRLNENTSLSFSGFHLGHHMSAAKSDEMSELLGKQMNLIIASGVCPSRWGVALQVLLEKVAGVSLVTKLRSIQLYEADYNWFNKLIFHDQAMSMLQATGLMPEEHLSQKQSLAEDACFDKILTLDLARQSRRPMALVSIDAAQCYDRVNHLIMSLVWLALGVQRSAIAIILNCLQNMKLFTRTGFGDSSSFIGGHDQQIPFCGLGQGSKAAPASWLQLSTMIINAYRAQGHGATFEDPVTKTLSKSIGCVYVDDTDIYTAGPQLDTIEQVVQVTRQAVPCWSRSLSATGGALKSSKSGWYLIAYENIDGNWVEREVPYDLVVPLPEPEGDTIITRHDMSEAIKSLGVFTSPVAGHEQHLEYICTRVNEWLIKVKNGHLPAALAWMSYTFQLWSGVRYGLGTLTNSLHHAIICLDGTDFKMLSFLGVNRNIRKGWRRLPHLFGGIGLFSLPIEQHICRVNLFCQHFGSPSTIGQKLLASLHWLQMQLGCNGNPLELDYAIWGHLATPGWITSFWEGLHSFPGDLIIKFEPIPLQRTGDTTLMHLAFDSGLRGSILKSFNRCRCASNMIFTSDIMTANGQSIEAKYTKPGAAPLVSKLSFPSEHPTPQDWGIWTAFWNSPERQLALGGWVAPPHFQWPWVYDDREDMLYEAMSSGWRKYQRLTGRTRRQQGYVAMSQQQSVPTGYWVSIRTLYCMGSRIITDPQRGPTPALDHQLHRSVWDLLHSWGGEWMWSSLFFPSEDNDISWLVSALEDGTLIGCTDGSYDGKRSTQLSSAGWILFDSKSRKPLAGSFCEYSPGASSYRGEMLGLCALQLLLLAIDTWFSPQNVPTLTIYCDNEKAGERAQEEHRRIKPGWSCSDVLRSFRDTKLSIRLPMRFAHVSAHMDDLLSWDQLTQAEQLNCMCDSLAKAALNRGILEHYSDSHNMLPRELAAVIFSDGKATSDPAEQLRLELGRREAREFLTQEIGWTLEQFDLVAWKHLNDTLTTKPLAFRLWLAKQHSGFCATGMMMKRCKVSNDDRCPSCWRRKERADHLCVCPNKAGASLLDESVRDLEQWMEKNDNTNAELAYWIPKYIRSRGRLKFCELGTMSTPMERIARDQDIIGWKNFMEGRVCQSIAQIQMEHLTKSSSRLNVDMWMRTFISKLLHTSHAQWILRNFMLHDSQSGYLRLKDRLTLITKIAELSSTSPEDLPEESRFLLEIDTNRLAGGDIDEQDYWVHAMEAAQAARSISSREPHNLPAFTTKATLGNNSTFALLEEIRVEQVFRWGCKNMTCRGPMVELQATTSEAHRMAKQASNRRRKPD